MCRWFALLCLLVQAPAFADPVWRGAAFVGDSAALLKEINQRNFGYFEKEVEKLDAWADDLKLVLEQEIKEIDREIKEVRRTAAISPSEVMRSISNLRPCCVNLAFLWLFIWKVPDGDVKCANSSFPHPSG